MENNNQFVLIKSEIGAAICAGIALKMKNCFDDQSLNRLSTETTDRILAIINKTKEMEGENRSETEP